MFITFTTALLLVANEKSSTSISDSDLDKEIGLVDESICEVFEPELAEEDCSEEREDFFPVEEPNFNFDENPVVENADIEEAAAEVQMEDKEVETLDAATEVQMEDKEAETLDAAQSHKVEEKWPLRSGSKGMGNRDIYANKTSREDALGAQVKVGSGKGIGNNQALCCNLGSFGSLRAENEWRRTLSCKRHNADDESEGALDMLWNHNRSEGMKMLWDIFNNKEEEEENNGSEDGMDMLWETFYEEERNTKKGSNKQGKSCCLPVWKFSTRKMKFSIGKKMNLGIGSPNLLKFSKALKGISFSPSAFRNDKMNLGMGSPNLFKFSKSLKGISFTLEHFLQDEM